MDVRCRKTECIHNDRFTCKVKDLQIGENDLCLSYQSSGKKKRDYSKKIFKETPCFAPQRDVNKMKIKCENKCLFNCEGRCIANGITINDLQEKPYCMTQLKK